MAGYDRSIGFVDSFIKEKSTHDEGMICLKDSFEYPEILYS